MSFSIKNKKSNVFFINQKKIAISFFLKEDEIPHISNKRFNNISPITYALTKSESEKVKSIVEQLRCSKRRESDENVQVFRPWGNYISVDYSSRWKIKKIEVNPGASLSLQLHKMRAEHWVVVEGNAKIEIDEKEFNLKANQSCFVPIGAKHRLSNPFKEKLVIIEVQSGQYLGEDDIV